MISAAGWKSTVNDKISIKISKIEKIWIILSLSLLKENDLYFSNLWNQKKYLYQIGKINAKISKMYSIITVIIYINFIVLKIS